MTPYIRRRTSALKHKAFARLFSGTAPYYIVNEFPKSGGTWLATMLSDALEVPFRRNEPVRLERSVVHGHFLNRTGLRNVAMLWRDPRDLLVSFYYHCYFVNEHHNAGLVALMKANQPFSDYDDIRENLPTFIRSLSAKPVSPSFTWPEFVGIWGSDQRLVHSTYETLRADTAQELSRIVAALGNEPLAPERATDIVDRHSFSRAKAAAESQQTSDTQMSFVREGSLGGWRKHFTPAAVESLKECGYVEPMRQLGYDIDVQ